MLAALLEYSRISSRTEEKSTFDCNKLVKSILSDFWREIDTTKTSINLIDLPESLIAEQKQIRVLFSHLLDNAIKFRHSDTPPIIEISAKHQEGAWLFNVIDEGIGIPEEQYKNVFQMFRRLNPDPEISGIGAGLTVAKKIVEYHGGKIWIENCEKTIISFTLPKI
ncbi:ATP-binding protein [Alphaproteobacteria bacterium]|nr:ATP-binding protein [Alphaproteobacteria bacterium]